MRTGKGCVASLELSLVPMQDSMISRLLVRNHALVSCPDTSPHPTRERLHRLDLLRTLLTSTVLKMLEELSGDADSQHPFYHKSPGLRAVVGLTSALSIVGSLLIILSYLCFKDLRTKAREILMHISFMDMGVGLSNLVGIGVNFTKYYTCFNSTHEHLGNDDARTPCNGSSLIEGLCLAQGSLATSFTIGSVLWTICLSMYLFILISQKGTREAKIFMRFAYFFCYLIPVGLIVWLNFTKRVGYSPFESTGWCGAIFVRPNKKREIVASIFGYNLWMALTFVLVPVLSISTHIYIRDEVCSSIMSRNKMQCMWMNVVWVG